MHFLGYLQVHIDHMGTHRRVGIQRTHFMPNCVHLMEKLHDCYNPLCFITVEHTLSALW